MVVGNIHVLFNMKRGELKLAQTRVLFETVADLADQYACPAIICGDFNSTPDSPLYSFLHTGALDLLRHDRRLLGGPQARGNSPIWAQRGPTNLGMLQEVPYPAPAGPRHHQDHWLETLPPSPGFDRSPGGPRSTGQQQQQLVVTATVE